MVFVNRMNRHYVWVPNCCCGLRFTEESLPSCHVRSQFRSQDLHGDLASELGLLCQIYLAHPASTDRAIDFIEATDAKGDDPFFCALMFNAPHSPWLRLRWQSRSR